MAYHDESFARHGFRGSGKRRTAPVIPGGQKTAVRICTGFHRTELSRNLGNGNTMKKKPDALVVLAFVFALGVLISTITHGGNDSDLERFANSAGMQFSNYDTK